MRALSKRQRRVLLLVGIVVVSALGPGAVAAAVSFLTNPAAVTSGATFAADSGMNVTLNENADVDTSLFPDSNTVEIVSSEGNITVSASGPANASIDNINGTWTNVSAIDATTNDVTLDPDDKQSITVGAQIDSIDFRDVKADDGTVDFVYAGTSGDSTVTITGLAANTDFIAVDADTGENLGGATSDSNGDASFTLPNSEHDVLLKSSDGGPGLSDPQPEGEQSTFPSKLSVEVSDPDFDDGENVTVEFYLDGSKVGENSTTSAGRVSVSIGSLARGAHDAKAVATDSNGNTKTLTWTFSVPNELEIREVTDPQNLINDRQVNLTFFVGDDIITRNVSDGNVSLEGLPTDEDIVVQAEAENYTTAEFIIEDITKQDSLYLLHTSEPSYTIRFTLKDRTGDFEGNGAQLLIQKPIDIGNGEEWQTMYGDYFGSTGVTADLEQDQTYRLIVKNEDNDMRVLGRYTAEQSEVVELTVGSVTSVSDGDDQAYRQNATYDNTTSGNYVKYEYNDTEDLTSSVTVTIFERGNESNVLFPKQTFSGPLGTISISEPVPSDQTDLSWTVDVTIQRNGESFDARFIVGPQRPVLQEIPGWLKALISIGSLWIVAGLFSQINGDVGAVATAGLGGMWWFVDFLPAETGIGVVVLAMLTAGAMVINNRRGSSL